MEELWEDIPNYEGHYQISSAGKVYSYKSNRIISQNHFRGGYKMTILTKNNISKQYSVHRIVADVFVPNPNNKKIVNHKDGNKGNNYWLNLEYVTSSENTIHAHKNNLIKVNKGEQVYNSKVKDKDVPEIRRLYKSGLTLQQISSILNISKSVIHNIVRYKSRAHIGD